MERKKCIRLFLYVALFLVIQIVSFVSSETDVHADLLKNKTFYITNLAPECSIGVTRQQDPWYSDEDGDGVKETYHPAKKYTVYNTNSEELTECPSSSDSDSVTRTYNWYAGGTITIKIEPDGDMYKATVKMVNVNVGYHTPYLYIYGGKKSGSEGYKYHPAGFTHSDETDYGLNSSTGWGVVNELSEWDTNDKTFFYIGAGYGYNTVTVDWNYEVYLTVNGNAGISSVSGEGWYYPGTWVTVSATASTGYHGVSWSGYTSLSSFYMPSYPTSMTASTTPNTYTVKYGGNGATGGSTADSSHTYNVDQNLTANGYERKYTVTWSANGGTCSTSSSTAAYTFAGWATSADGAVSYSNQQSVKNLTTTNNGTVNLYAKWNSASVTAPTPSRKGYIFQGWYAATSGGGCVVGGGGSYTPTANVTLYAQWKPIKYTVYLKSTKPGNATHDIVNKAPAGWTWDASVGMYKCTFTYDHESTIPTVPATYTLVGWDVTDGWYQGTVKKGSGTGVWNLTDVNNGSVTLTHTWTANMYRVWLKNNKPSGASTALGTPADAAASLSGWTKSGDDYYKDFAYDSDESLPVTSKVYSLEGYDVSTGWFKLGYDVADVMAEHSADLYDMHENKKSAYAVGNKWHDCAACDHTGTWSGTLRWNLTTINGDTVYLYPYWIPHTYSVEYNSGAAHNGVNDVDRGQDSNIYDGTSVTKRTYCFDDAWSYLKTTMRGNFNNETVVGAMQYTKGYPFIYSNYYHYTDDDTRALIATESSKGQAYTTAYDKRYSVVFKDSDGHCTIHPSKLGLAATGRNAAGFDLDNNTEVDYWDFLGWSVSYTSGAASVPEMRSVAYADAGIRSDRSSVNLVAEGHEPGNMTSTDGVTFVMTPVWRDLGIKYPKADEAQHSFAGWYTNKQVPTHTDSNGRTVYNNRGTYYGGGEVFFDYNTLSRDITRNDAAGSRAIETDMVLYAW